MKWYFCRVGISWKVGQERLQSLKALRCQKWEGALIRKLGHMKTIQSPGHPPWGSTLLISFMFFLDLDLFLVTWWVIFLQASPHLILSTICWEWFWFYYCHPFIEELRVPWTAKRSNQTILKKINPEYSLEGLMLKLQYFGPPDTKSWLTGREPDAGKDWRQEGEGGDRG